MSVDFPNNRLTAAFERRVARVLDAAIPRGAPIVVACSGGPDSTAALLATIRARGSGAGLTAAYFDHAMRPRADIEADRAAVEALTASLGAAFVSGAAEPPPPASEAGARAARYRWLMSACIEARAAHCLTGHTLDDQAETVLLRLTRGAGLRGASGMEVEAPWPLPNAPVALRLVRPLLATRRLEVVAYLAALAVEPRFDATNELVTFHRNRVRHRVLPELRAVNPRVDDALVRFAALARRDDEALEAWAEYVLTSMARVDVAGGCAVLDRRALRALPPAVATRVLRRVARDLGLRPDGEQIEAMARLAGRRGSRLSLAGASFEVETAAVVLRRLDGASEDEPD